MQIILDDFEFHRELFVPRRNVFLHSEKTSQIKDYLVVGRFEDVDELFITSIEEVAVPKQIDLVFDSFVGSRKGRVKAVDQITAPRFRNCQSNVGVTRLLALFVLVDEEGCQGQQ